MPSAPNAFNLPIISQKHFSSSTVCTEHQPSCANGITVGLFIPGSTAMISSSFLSAHSSTRISCLPPSLPHSYGTTTHSESLSLLVIDEAAIVRWASAIWAAAFPTLSTGGSAIINSTPYGMGNFLPFNMGRCYSWR